MSGSLSVNVGSVSLKSPLVLASGTCNFGRELAEYYDLSILGGISSKGLTIKPRAGNPGVHYFIENDLDFMKESGAAVIVNVAGHSYEDYMDMVKTLDPHKDKIDALEINLSCPNVKEGCMTMGSDPLAVTHITSELRKLTELPLWIKLTPNVTDIKVTALAAQEGGADAVVLINTLMGMRINIRTRRPVLTNNTGGYSGPAVKPVAIRMIAECSKMLDIPIVGCGGIASFEDVIEFMIAGASAVEIGTACLIHPALPVKITEDLEKYCEENSILLKNLTGTLQLW